MARDITQRRQIEEKLQRQAHDLGERVKELTGLYSLSRLIEKKGNSLEDIFKGVVALIPDAWQYPVKTCARLIVEDKEYTTSNWRDTVWKQTADIHVHGAPFGSIEICYLEQMPNIDEGPFLKEERDLINAIVERLGHVIERMQAAESLYLSEQKYRNIFENAIEGIFQSTTEGRYISVNQAFARIGGFNSPDEMINTVTDIQREMYIHPEDRIRLIELLKSQDVVNNFEVEIQRKDGILIWISINVKLVEDRTGKTKYLEGTIIDITERKQAEEALRESKERYRTLVDKAFEAIIVIQNGEIVFANPRAYEIVSYPRDRTEPKAFMDFLHSEDREIVIGRHLKRLQGEQLGETYTLRLVDQSGKVKWALISTALIDWEGKPATLTFLADITERKQSEISLKESEEKYRSLFNKAPVGIAISTIGGTVVDLNDAQAEMIGYTVEELRGKSVNEYYVNPDKRKEMVEKFQKDGILRDFEMQLRKKDGSVITELLNFDQVQIGGSGFILVTGRDVTDLRQSEKALQDSEAQYRLLAENSRDIIWTMDMNLKFTYMSPSVLTIRGYTVEEVMAQSVEEIFTPSSLEIALKAFEEEFALESVEPKDLSRTRTLELEHIRRDGATVWVEINAFFPARYKGPSYRDSRRITGYHRAQAGSLMPCRRAKSYIVPCLKTCLTDLPIAS